MPLKTLQPPKAGIDRSKVDDNSFKQHTLGTPNRLQLLSTFIH